MWILVILQIDAVAKLSNPDQWNFTTYSMIHLNCNILWWHNSKTNQDNPNLKKSLVGIGLAFYDNWCPGFLRISDPLNKQLNKTHAIQNKPFYPFVKSFFEIAFFGLSFWCQIGLKYRGVYNWAAFDFIPPLPLIFFPATRRVALQNLWFSSSQSNKTVHYRSK